MNVSLKPALASEVVREARTRTAQLAAFNRDIGSRLALLERGDTLEPEAARTRLRQKSRERRKRAA